MSELRGELSVRESELDSLRERETAYLDELAALKIEIDAKKPATNPARCFSSTKNNNSSSDLISFESAEATLILSTNEEETIMESCVSTLGGGGEENDRCSSIIVIQRPLHEATLCVEEDEDYKKRYFELREGLFRIYYFLRF